MREKRNRRPPRGRKGERDGGGHGGGGPGSPGGTVALWGVHACREAIANPRRTIASITLDRPPQDWLSSALESAGAAGVSRPDPVVVPRPELQALVPPQAVHQGIVVQAAPLPTPGLDELVQDALSRPSAILVVLDQVEDPHNVGAIMRSAAAFGAAGLIVQSRHAPPLSGTLIKAASGGFEHVPVVEVTNIARTLERLARSGIECAGLAEEAHTPLSGYTPAARTALVLGAEGPGLRRLVSQACDTLVCLPTSGPIKTLNVSNAAAIALHHIALQQYFSN